ncbi:MAG TPA: urease accessory protein UreD [Polyangia bacterium]
MLPFPTPDQTGWEASLRLGFAARDGATYVARRVHRGPLVVQRAFFPEGRDVAHVYLLHPPGGFVGGDSVALEVEVDPGAHALITTPAAGKAYRSDGVRTARVSQHLDVRDGATLEWFPQETIVFDGARIDLTTRVDLGATGRFCGWEILCLGRAAAGETLVNGTCRQRFELSRAGIPLVIDKTQLDGGGPLLAAPYGLGGKTVLGTMILSPVVGDLESVRLILTEFGATASSETIVATVVDGALVCRYLGDSAERARRVFLQVWSALRPALCGRPPRPPRIWLT